MFADTLYKESDMFAASLYKEVWHVCRLTLQRGVTCLQPEFTLYKKVSHVCRPTLQRGVTCLQPHFTLYKEVTCLQNHFPKRCDMFAESLYKEV